MPSFETDELDDASVVSLEEELLLVDAADGFSLSALSIHGPQLLPPAPPSTLMAEAMIAAFRNLSPAELVTAACHARSVAASSRLIAHIVRRVGVSILLLAASRVVGTGCLIAPTIEPVNSACPAADLAAFAARAFRLFASVRYLPATRTLLDTACTYGAARLLSLLKAATSSADADASASRDCGWRGASTSGGGSAATPHLLRTLDTHSVSSRPVTAVSASSAASVHMTTKSLCSAHVHLLPAAAAAGFTLVACTSKAVLRYFDETVVGGGGNGDYAGLNGVPEDGSPAAALGMHTNLSFREELPSGACIAQAGAAGSTSRASTLSPDSPAGFACVPSQSPPGATSAAASDSSTIGLMRASPLAGTEIPTVHTSPASAGGPAASPPFQRVFPPHLSESSSFAAVRGGGGAVHLFDTYSYAVPLCAPFDAFAWPAATSGAVALAMEGRRASQRLIASFVTCVAAAADAFDSQSGAESVPMTSAGGVSTAPGTLSRTTVGDFSAEPCEKSPVKNLGRTDGADEVMDVRERRRPALGSSCDTTGGDALKWLPCGGRVRPHALLRSSIRLCVVAVDVLMCLWYEVVERGYTFRDPSASGLCSDTVSTVRSVFIRPVDDRPRSTGSGSAGSRPLTRGSSVQQFAGPSLYGRGGDDDADVPYDLGPMLRGHRRSGTLSVATHLRTRYHDTMLQGHPAPPLAIGSTVSSSATPFGVGRAPSVSSVPGGSVAGSYHSGASGSAGGASGRGFRERGAVAPSALPAVLHLASILARFLSNGRPTSADVDSGSPPRGPIGARAPPILTSSSVDAPGRSVIACDTAPIEHSAPVATLSAPRRRSHYNASPASLPSSGARSSGGGRDTPASRPPLASVATDRSAVRSSGSRWGASRPIYASAAGLSHDSDDPPTLAEALEGIASCAVVTLAVLVQRAASLHRAGPGSVRPRVPTGLVSGASGVGASDRQRPSMPPLHADAVQVRPSVRTFCAVVRSLCAHAVTDACARDHTAWQSALAWSVRVVVWSAQHGAAADVAPLAPVSQLAALLREHKVAVPSTVRSDIVSLAAALKSVPRAGTV